MKILIYILLLCTFIISCKKNKFEVFPKGNYKLVDYNYENVCDTSASFGFGTTYAVKGTIYELEDPTIIENSFEFDGKKHLVYHSDKGTEKFKILDCEVVYKETYFQNDGQYSTKYIVMTLKNDFKKYAFKFHLVDDTTIIGVYWQKKQNYFAADKPNVAYYTCNQPKNVSTDGYNMVIIPPSSYLITERFGVFRKN
jgi:hypothetical protein